MALGIMHIYELFSLDRRKTWQCYIDIIILLGIIEIVCHSRANIHISKCYSAKNYLAKCYKRKNLKYFWELIFLYVKINLSHKQSYRITDDLWCITYYIIYTLTRIENVLIYIIHAYMHWP